MFFLGGPAAAPPMATWRVGRRPDRYEMTANHPGRTYLNSLEPWKGKGNFSLKPIQNVLASLGNPQNQIPAIHIGGTNGKGSVSAMLASILRQHGCRVGLSTSPHLVRVNERIAIDGVPVSDQILLDTALRLQSAAVDVNETLSYHEALTALAFMIFADLKLDWMVIEVGLGGRLDASNVIAKPKIVAITSIGRDHEAILGSELTSIAREKAAIVKPECITVVGDLPIHLSEIIAKNATNIAFYGADFSAQQDDKRHLVFRSKFGASEFELSDVALSGEFQLNNIAVAIEIALRIGIPVRDIKAGIELVEWPGRLERLSYGSTSVILDGAHNIDAIAALLLDHKYNNINKLTLVFGVLGSKRWQQMVEQLVPFVANWHLVEPDSEMAVKCQQLADHLSCFDITPQIFGRDVRAALKSASAKSDQLLVCGSLYLVGEARAIITAPIELERS